MEFCIYDLATGQIRIGGTCADSDFEHQQVPDGCGILALPGNPHLQYVQDGHLQPIPPAPDQWSRWDWETKTWIASPTADVVEIRWRMVRAERDKKIALTDWTQLPDVPVVTQKAWSDYRQALRDITQQSDPANITWPEPPYRIDNTFVS